MRSPSRGTDEQLSQGDEHVKFDRRGNEGSSHHDRADRGAGARRVARAQDRRQQAHALELKEANYPPVVYVPRADMDMNALQRTARVTTCPYKGEANYYSIADGQIRDDNAVWTYETPIADVAEIASHLAFYPDKVEVLRGE